MLKRFTLAVAMLLCLVLLSGLFVTGEKSANVSAKATQRYTVIIDAGHGELVNTTDWFETCRENSI